MLRRSRDVGGLKTGEGLGVEIDVALLTAVYGRLSRGSARDFYVRKLAEGVSTLAAAFYPKPGALSPCEHNLYSAFINHVSAKVSPRNPQTSECTCTPPEEAMQVVTGPRTALSFCVRKSLEASAVPCPAQ